MVLFPQPLSPVNQMTVPCCPNRDCLSSLVTVVGCQTIFSERFMKVRRTWVGEIVDEASFPLIGVSPNRISGNARVE